MILVWFDRIENSLSFNINIVPQFFQSNKLFGFEGTKQVRRGGVQYLQKQCQLRLLAFIYFNFQFIHSLQSNLIIFNYKKPTWPIIICHFPHSPNCVHSLKNTKIPSILLSLPSFKKIMEPLISISNLAAVNPLSQIIQQLINQFPYYTSVLPQSRLPAFFGWPFFH